MACYCIPVSIAQLQTFCHGILPNYKAHCHLTATQMLCSQALLITKLIERQIWREHEKSKRTFASYNNQLYLCFIKEIAAEILMAGMSKKSLSYEMCDQVRLGTTNSAHRYTYNLLHLLSQFEF